MSDSERIEIGINKGSLTVQMHGKDPLVVIKGDDDVRATDYAKILRLGILAGSVDHMKRALAEQPLSFSSDESGGLVMILKVFELELAARKSK